MPMDVMTLAASARRAYATVAALLKGQPKKTVRQQDASTRL